MLSSQICALRWGRVSHLLSYPIAHSATRAEMSDFTQIASQPGHILSRSETSPSGQSVVAWRLGYAEVFLRIGSAQLSYFFIGDVTLDEHMHLAVSAHQSGINLVAPIDAQCLIERPLARINRNRPSAHGG